MEHFDKAYGLIYRKNWPSIRAALLTKHKSVALVNNYGDPEKIIQELKLSGAFNLKSLIEQKNLVAVDEMSSVKSHNVQAEFIPGKSFHKFHLKKS